ncbi:uncharacterized protein LOC133338388 [Musca vetustissima]|uniref:uncharacterized protein LOC133338388 n=1 Tax=Musca vetustissima TaxID=27455 RepID=UPI002AB5EE33|nr:uncharacterized protein LOC133338388 [Musca vetustissima]
MATLKNFWIEFIDLYKSLPELWKRDAEEYGNRHIRKKAYEVMVDKYNEIDKEANIYTVKKKINNMRTAFRRELNKMRKSEQNASSPNEIYTPTLWYYSHLEFLIDEMDDEDDMDATTATKMELMDDIGIMNDEYPINRAPTPSTSSQSKKRKFEISIQQPEQKRQYSQQPQDHNIIQRQQHQQTPTVIDPVRALSSSWEVLYRDLDKKQQLYANRMINEVLYQAALGKLSENSYKLLEMAVDEPNGHITFSPDRESETQYYLTESTEHDEIIMKKDNERKRPKNSKQLHMTK